MRNLLAQAKELQFAVTTAESKRLAKEYGITGLPTLSTLRSLSFPRKDVEEVCIICRENWY
ncbi:hypothetical protein H1R20_g7166, partial [Candolleomyces eurysporus]